MPGQCGTIDIKRMLERRVGWMAKMPFSKMSRRVPAALSDLGSVGSRSTIA